MPDLVRVSTLYRQTTFGVAVHGPSHRLVGAAAGTLVLNAHAGSALLQHPLLLLGSLVLGAWGGTAPDWLEVPYGTGRRLITHRTVTHWVPVWCGLLWCAYQGAWAHPTLQLGLQAFLFGGLSHLLMDWPNPRGVPVFWPTKRHSLALWNSGQHDVKLVVLLGTLAVARLLAA